MLSRHAGFPASLMASAAALAVALTFAACGEDNNDDGSANASQDDPAASSSAASSEREEAANAMRELRTAFNAKDGAAYCALLSTAGKRQMMGYAASVPGVKKGSCPAFMTDYSSRIVKMGGAHRPVRVRKVTVNGDKGTIVMQGGMAGIRSIATFKLAKENGTWKLADPVTGTSTRTLPEQYK